MTPLRLCALPGLTALHAVTARRLVRILPGVPVVIPPNATNAVKRAATDLHRDLAAVLGTESPMLTQRPAEGLCIEIQEPAPSMGGPESHGIHVVTPPGTPPRIVLSGSDMRGLIYAIYSFSEHVLDVPPLWFFAAWKPVRQSVVELPSDFAMDFPAPHVRWRGWFPNDKDMYDAWEKNASEEKHDRVLETMLRLKLNVLAAWHRA